MVRAARSTVLATTSSIPQVRRLLHRVCDDLHVCQAVRDDDDLAITEAVTNVVRHAYPTQELGLVELSVDHIQGRLTILVVDHGVGRHHGAEADPRAGFGVDIIEQLADVRWSATEGGGTTVALSMAVA